MDEKGPWGGGRRRCRTSRVENVISSSLEYVMYTYREKNRPGLRQDTTLSKKLPHHIARYVILRGDRFA